MAIYRNINRNMAHNQEMLPHDLDAAWLHVGRARLSGVEGSYYVDNDPATQPTVLFTPRSLDGTTNASSYRRAGLTGKPANASSGCRTYIIMYLCRTIATRVRRLHGSVRLCAQVCHCAFRIKYRRTAIWRNNRNCVFREWYNIRNC